MSLENVYCVCKVCVTDPKECELQQQLTEHAVAVEILLPRSSIVEVHLYNESSQSSNLVMSCHLNLLIYHSRVVKREVQRQSLARNIIRTLTFRGLAIRHNDLKRLINWCYAGQLREPVMFLRDNLERLWNLASGLEMPSFANYCMTSIMTKYAYHFKEDIRNFCGPDAKLPEHDGYLYDGPLAFRAVPIFEHWVLSRPKLNIAKWWLNTRQDWMIKIPVRPLIFFDLPGLFDWSSSLANVQCDSNLQQIDVCRKLRENEDDAPDKNYTVDFDLKKCMATKEFEKFEESLRLAHKSIETSMRDIQSQQGSRKRARESEENEASSEVVKRRSKQQ
ncbi:hypothetical protein SUNI508_01535 [Seiridium unicorne]|uniref:Uncharacterized protein n=1 Tax=Seiridium unicorne TaxID=138068 RepID=A0ABR2UTI2_9PEZI